jgi:hypothetical protein
MQQITRVRRVRDWSGLHAWGAVLLAASIAWFLFWRDPAASARRECARRYAAAATAADTLRVGAQAAGRGTKGGAWNCGMLRRAP